MANSTLTRTVSAASTQTKFTFSAWVKRCAFLADHVLYGMWTDADNRSYITINDTDNLSFFQKIGGTTTANLKTNAKLRDPSAWYHIYVAIDTTQVTEADRMKFYINGILQTSFNTATYPAKDSNLLIQSSSGTKSVGSVNSGSYLNGYMSHVAFVDGSVVAHTSFGQTDSTSGIWKFKPPSGVTWGTNGFHLKMENSGALGTDSSGNSNTFAVNGNLKQAVDTPSNVYCTLNTLNKQISGATLSNGNNTLTTTSGSPYTGTTGSTLAFNTGKWYFEAQCTTSPNSTYPIFGFGDVTQVVSGGNQYLGDPSSFTNISVSTGRGTSNVYKTGSSTSTYSASDFPFSTNDILMVAIDYDNDKIWWGKNGTWLASGDPANGNNPSQTGFISTITPNDNFITPYFGDENYSSSATINVNFGNGFFGTTAITSAGSNGNGSLFEYDVPSGFYALNTKNINTYG